MENDEPHLEVNDSLPVEGLIEIYQTDIKQPQKTLAKELMINPAWTTMSPLVTTKMTMPPLCSDDKRSLVHKGK